MRAGVLLPVTHRPTRESLREMARLAESLGFDSLWANSHTAVPVDFRPRYPYSPTGVPPWDARSDWADALVTLAYVAGLTERVRLGTSVIPLVTTDPLTLAKQAATVDVVSGGRLELGIGAGWMAEEGAALGRPTDHRTARLEETIEILRLAWTRETLAFQGEHFRFPEVGVHPHPVQGGELPIWLGGHGEAVIRIAAQRGCGILYWYPAAGELEAFAAKLAGRKVPLGTSLRLAESGDWRRRALELRAAGAELLVITPDFRGRPLEQVERFAREVLPELR
jgi:probable F420-dependent oxidoreductase